MDEGEEFLKKLGGNIKKLRLEAGMSQTDLGYACNFERSTMNRIEAGRTNPTVLTLRLIADALNVELSKLLEF